LQAVFTVIGARAGYVAPRTVSPLGDPEGRVARAQTNTLENAPTGRLEGADHKARA
jgi:hypothetical protein